MFLQANSEEFKNHSILPDLRSPSNYAPLRKNSTKTIIVLSSRIVRKKKVSLRSLRTKLVTLTLLISLTGNHLKE